MRQDSSTNESVFPRQLGRYVLLSHLGEGGMGRVYLALSRERGRERLSVIKRFGNPRARFTPDQIDENRRRFRREAKITMALAHPHIARTFAHVEAGNDAYLVEEFVRGVTLDYLASAVAAAEQFPIPVAASVVSTLAAALDYLHDFRGLGLVHRDLTPANVMVSQAGEVKIIDFGIAKATIADDGLSKPNVLMGKPLWTAPEVLAGDKADRRADLYSLGLILWSLLAGRGPEESVLGDVFLRQPSAFNSAVPLELDEIVTRAIAPRPDQRFQTARAFREALMPFTPPAPAAEKVLALMLAGCQPTLKKRYFDEVVARGRPLLDRISPPPRWRGVVLVGISSALAIVGVHAALYEAPSEPQPSPSQEHIVPASRPAPSVAVAELAKLAEALPETTAPSPPPALSVESQTQPPLPRGRRRHQSPSAPAAATTLPCPERGSTAPLQSADDLLGSAFEALGRGDTEQAVKLARASLEKRKTADAYILIARILFVSDPAAAQAALESALALAPSNRQAARLLEGLRQRTP